MNRNWTILGLILLTAALIFFVVRVFIPSLTSVTHSYPAYYAASRLVLEGKWSPEIYYDPWFEARVKEVTEGRVTDHFSLHPPTTSLLLVPIAWLDITTARTIWQLVNLGLFAGALWLLLDVLGKGNTVWRIFFVAFALVYTPLLENFRVGQSYVLLLFLFALALWGEMRSKFVWTGLGLGLAAGLKLSGGFLWLLLAVRGQWRALAWGIGVGLLSVLVGLSLGVQGWIAFFVRLMGSTEPGPLAAHPAYQTTASFFQHMFVPSAKFNPTPLFNVPWLAGWLSMVILIVAVGLTLWFGRKAPIEIAYAAALTLSVILFPQAIEYHYTILLIPLAVMSSVVLSTRTRQDAIWLVVVLILFYVPFDWNAPVWGEGVWMLLAYPRLYAGWLMWLWFVRRMSTVSEARYSLPAGAVAE